MCLFTKDLYPSIAENDIVCYKIIKYIGEQPLTPYMSLPISNDVLLGEKLFCADDKKFVEFDNWHSISCVSGGYIHTFSTIESAKFCMLYDGIHFMFNLNIDLIAYECIIPKDVEYYSGFSETGSSSSIFSNKKNIPINSYASEKIKFVRKITDMEMFGYERKQKR